MNKYLKNMLSAVHTFNLYELINKYFRNDEDSKKFLFEIDNFVITKMNSGDHRLATKADVKELDEEIGYIKKDINHIKADISDIRSEISDVRLEVSKLEIKMGEGFREILKWIIILMIGFGSLIIASIKVFS